MFTTIKLTSDDTIVKHGCHNCSKKGCSIINDLHFDELIVLEDRRHLAKFRAGDLIFKEGTKPTALMALSEGKVKITRKGSLGNELIIELKKPVDFIGFNALMRGELHSNNAIAIEDCEICYINKNDFFKVVENNSNLSGKIIKLFADELNHAQQRTLNLTQMHLRGRMSEALLLVEDIFGVSPKDDSIDVSLRRADYASISNMTTSNAIRVLSAFNKEGLIHLEGRKITILDKKSLERIYQNG